MRVRIECLFTILLMVAVPLMIATPSYAQLGGGGTLPGLGGGLGGGLGSGDPVDPPDDPDPSDDSSYPITNFWSTNGNGHYHSGTTSYSDAAPMLVYVDNNGAWLNDYGTVPMLVLLSPSKHVTIGQFYCGVGFGNHQVAELVLGSVIDTDGLPTFNSRWADKSSNDFGGLHYNGDTIFNSPTTIPDTSHRFAPTDVYGLSGMTDLEIVPYASDIAYADISDFSNITYAVATYTLKFDANRPEHRAGLMMIGIVGSSKSWQAVTPGVNLHQEISSIDVTSNLYVAVQRKGDANLDGLVNGDDVYWFLLAQNDPIGYMYVYKNVPPNFNCDMDDNGVINEVDVDLFVIAVLSGGITGEYWTEFDQSV